MKRYPGARAFVSGHGAAGPVRTANGGPCGSLTTLWPSGRMRPMPWIRRLLLLLFALYLGACSDNDTTVDPGPSPASPPVIRAFSATETDIVHGDWTQLRWTVENATVAAISPGIGVVPSSGVNARSIRPARTTTYEITASNSEGTVSAAVEVTVNVSSSKVASIV